MARHHVAAAVALAVLTAAAAADPLDGPRASLRKRDYPAAVAALEAALAAGPADAHRSEARSLLAKAASDGADDLQTRGDDEAAERTLVTAARAIAPDPRAAELLGHARRVLRTGYAAAVKRKAYDRALWAATTAAADFPADRPLANEAAVQLLRAEVAGGDMHTAGPARAYEVLLGLYAAKVPVTSIDRAGIDRAAVGLADCDRLRQLGWSAEAAVVAGDTLAVGHLPPAGGAAVAAARSGALGERARACLSFGNRAMATAAVAAFTAAARPADAAEAGRLRSALAKLTAAPPDPEPSVGPPKPPPASADVDPQPTAEPATEPATGPTTRLAYTPFQNDAAVGPRATTRPSPATVPAVAARPAPVEPVHLALAGPAAGEQAWVDGGSGYTLDGATVRTGNGDREHGGAWAPAQVHVGPGLVLEDGTITVSAGTVHLEGTADRPVVLRRVRFDCEYTGSLDARFTLFEDCTFEKVGGWHWQNGYNAKWTMADCLLVGCGFRRLNAADMGLHLDRCGLVGMAFPPRFYWDQAQANRADDAAAFYRGEWSHVADCDFHDCGFPVSPLWMCVGCNFRRCRVTGPGTFPSATPLSSVLGVSDDDRPFYDAVTAGTATSGDGRVTYRREAKGFPRPAGPTTLYRLAAAYPRPTP